MNLSKKEKEKLSNKEYQYFKTQPIQTKDLDALFDQYVPPEEISDKDRKKIIERNKKEKARIKKSETNLEKKIAEHNWKGMPTPQKSAINKQGRLISKSESHRKIKFDQKEGKLVGKKGSLNIPKNISMTPRFSYTLDEYNNLPLQDSETQNIIKYMLKRGGPPVKGIVPSKRKRGGYGTKKKKSSGSSTPPRGPRGPRTRILNPQIQYPDEPPTGYEWMADPMGNMVLIQTEESYNLQNREPFQGGRYRKKKTRKKKGGIFVRPEDLVEGFQYLYIGPEPHYLPDAELGVNIRITVRYLGRNVPGMTPNQYYFDGERENQDIFSIDSMNIINHIRHWPQNPRRGPTFENPNMRYTPTQRRESICENCTIMGGRKRKKSRRKKKTRRKTKKKSKRKKRKSRNKNTKKKKKY